MCPLCENEVVELRQQLPEQQELLGEAMRQRWQRLQEEKEQHQMVLYLLRSLAIMAVDCTRYATMQA